MYASSYEPEFCKAFRDSLGVLDVEPFEDAVKKMADRVSEAVVDRVHDDVRDHLISSITDSICQHAADVASRYLEEALAGDDKQIRNLLGLYDHATAYRFTRWSPRPTRWLLIEALMERRPDLFVDERIQLLTAQVEEQEREIIQWRERAQKAETEQVMERSRKMSGPDIEKAIDGIVGRVAHAAARRGMDKADAEALRQALRDLVATPRG